jgi:hypothetical protein
MKEKILTSWGDFVAIFEDVVAKKPEDLKPEDGWKYFSDVLFRGQSDSNWDLATTLERFSTRDYTPSEYYRLMGTVRRMTETVTGKSWDWEEKYKIEEDFMGAPDGYEFMVYARHHGFPSPLLDWTRSPFVAAFFAFSGTNTKSQGNVSIYRFQEYCGSGKSGGSGRSNIVGLGPYISTHKRHFLQHAEYTVCRKDSGDNYIFSSHEEALARDDWDQDHVVKYIIPSSERDKALRSLDLMNINAFSLMGTEDSLMETLAERQIPKR